MLTFRILCAIIYSYTTLTTARIIDKASFTGKSGLKSLRRCLINYPKFFQLRFTQDTNVTVQQIQAGQSNNVSTLEASNIMLSPRTYIVFRIEPRCQDLTPGSSTPNKCSRLTICSFMIDSQNTLVDALSGMRTNVQTDGVWHLKYSIAPDFYINNRYERYHNAPVKVKVYIEGPYNYYEWDVNVYILGSITSMTTFECRRSSAGLFRDKVILAPGDDFSCFIEPNGYGAGSGKTRVTKINASPYDFEKPYLILQDNSAFAGDEKVPDDELAVFNKIEYHEQETGVRADVTSKNSSKVTDIKLMILRMSIKSYPVAGRYCVVLEIKPEIGNEDGKRQRVRGTKNSCFTYTAPTDYRWVIYVVMTAVLVSVGGLVFFLKANK